MATYLGGDGRSARAVDLATEHREFHIHSVRFDDEDCPPGFQQPLHFELSLSLERAFRSVAFALSIHNSRGTRLLTSLRVIDQLDEGKTTLSIRIPDHHLLPGNYSLSLGIARGAEKIYYGDNVLQLSLSDLGLNDPQIQPYLARYQDELGAFIPGRWEKH